MKGADMLARALLFFLLAGFAVTVTADPSTKPDVLEVIELRTVITDGVAQAITSQVEKINENPKVKAVFLLVDSPGGGASASAVIYRELSRLKVPVVGFCEYLCASGGVYVLMASSVKYVGVRDDTIGGSVGVIWMNVRYHRLLEWAKIDFETYKSGQFKDAGNSTRPGDDAERKYLQGIVDQLATKFYGVVEKSRGKHIKDWAPIKGAKIFIGEDIVRVGLADEVMSKDAAIAKAKQLSGSKLIFTREEIAKMAKAATTDYHYRPTIPPSEGVLDRGMRHLDTAMELLQEVRQGESVRFEYRLPYRF